MRSARLGYNFHVGPFLFGHPGPYGALIRTDEKSKLIQLRGQIRRVHFIIINCLFGRKYAVGCVQGCE